MASVTICIISSLVSFLTCRTVNSTMIFRLSLTLVWSLLIFVNGDVSIRKDTVSTTTEPPQFLVSTEAVFYSASNAVSSLITFLRGPSFQKTALEVLQSEVRFFENVYHKAQQMLSFLSISSKTTDSFDWTTGFKEQTKSEQRRLSQQSELHTTPIPALKGQLGTQLITNAKVSTPFAAFWSSIASSFVLTMFTEFGDRTFFIAAILALRHPKIVVLCGTCSALIIQSVFSTLIGQLLHMLPSNATSSFMSFPLDDYAAAILLFVFGIIHLKAAWNPEDSIREDASSCSEKPDIADDFYIGCPEQETSPSRVNNLNLTNNSTLRVPLTVSAFDPYKVVDPGHIYNCEMSNCEKCSKTETTTSSQDGASTEDISSHSFPVSTSEEHHRNSVILQQPEMSQSSRTESIFEGRHSKNHEFREAAKAMQTLELRRSGSEQSKTLEIFKKTFWVIFVAELGDKSMFSTVALSAAQNPYGVFVGMLTALLLGYLSYDFFLAGSSLAHCVVTLVAVVASSFLDGFVSERIANIIGAILFLTFSVMTTLEGLARQGVRLWWFIGEKASAFFIAYFFTMKNVATIGSQSVVSQPSLSVDSVMRMIVS